MFALGTAHTLPRSQAALRLDASGQIKLSTWAGHHEGTSSSSRSQIGFVPHKLCGGANTIGCYRTGCSELASQNKVLGRLKKQGEESRHR